MKDGSVRTCPSVPIDLEVEHHRSRLSRLVSRSSVRKEVIQPHVPVRLPCYDFTPITNPTLVTYLPRRGWPSAFASCRLSWCDGRCVQAPGTHSPHYADARLLATPPSCRRVAADNLY